MAEILIIGAGPGGLEAAHTLREGLSRGHRITLVDRDPLFTFGLAKAWLLTGAKQARDYGGDRRQLVKLGINFLQGELESIDVAKKEVHVGSNKLLYDHLIIALGAQLSPDSTPGFSSFAKNLYTDDGCVEIARDLTRINSGTITVLICGIPFKCPAGPYELAMVTDDILRKRGVRNEIKLQIVSPEPQPLPVMGSEAGKVVIQLLEEREIEYYPSRKVKEVRHNNIVTEDGKEIRHDLIFAVPVHKAPEVLKKSGLLDQSGWVPVDPGSLSTNVPDVYAIGDCAGTKIPNGRLLPRLGTVAAGQGRVVAENLIHRIQAEEERLVFDGRGVCFVEVGDGKAALIHSRFYAKPDPEWDYSAPSADGLLEKHIFTQERTKAWFPTPAVQSPAYASARS